ncbi:MAG: sugar phosphate isomerase/epimerase [Deltaproteobacteria bacterium]|nr:MAG: sugar phosphate isomerase/epimerase [Deltaproteobacteria bacterium]
MKYGAMNFPIKPLLQEIEDIGELGFDYLELTMDPPEATPDKIRGQKEEILRALDRYGMDLVGHLPTFVLTSDLYESLRQISLHETIAAMEAGIELGIEKMVLHPSYLTGLAVFVRDRAKRYAMESLQAISDRAGELGITLCLENMTPKTKFLAAPEEFEEVFAAFPMLKLSLDTGHAHIGAHGNRGVEFLRKFGERVAHLHFNDNFGNEDNHLPIGAGIIDFQGIVKELKKIGYDDTLTIEVFSRDRDYLRISREKVQEMWGR